MRRVRTPFGMRCQRADGKFTRCKGGGRRRRRKGYGDYGALCRTRKGRFTRCR